MTRADGLRFAMDHLVNAGAPAIAAAIRWLLDDDERVASILDRAYRHPNQFDKLVLLRSDSGRWQLRLHVWRGVRERDADIHNHRWNFSSWVLKGRFRHHRFEIVQDAGREMLHYSWSDGCDAERPAPLQGLVRAVLTQTYALEAGDRYDVMAEILHAVLALEPGLSLVLQGPTVRHHSDILRPPSLGTSLPHAEPLTALEARDALELALRLLGNQ